MRIIEKIKIRLKPYINLIKEDYKTKSIKNIAKNYNLSPQTLTKILRSEGVCMKTISERARKYIVNERYFEKIDTEEKAYFLGFLYADGCNHKERARITICLQPQDKEILEKFKNQISYSGPILDNKHVGEDSITKYPTLAWCSRKMSEDLIKLGCLPRKSLILKFPTEDQVPEYLIRHFLRGFFDGDGWVTSNIYKKRSNCPNFTIGLVSTRQFCERADEIIEKYVNIKGVLTSPKIYKHGTSLLTYHGNLRSIHILNWLYFNATISLKRKRDKIIKISNQIIEYYSKLNRGVKLDKRHKKSYYYSYKMVDNKSFSIGSFSSYDEAVAASRAWDLQNKPICKLIKESPFFETNLLKI